MRNVGLGVWVIALGVAIAAGCAAPDVNGSGLRRGGNVAGDDDDDKGAPENGATPGGGTPSNQTAPPVTPDTGDVDTNPGDDTPKPPLVDADKDGFGDDVDCAPNDATIAGTKLLTDDLAADKGFFTQADGFPANWAYNAGYVQNRLAVAPDQAIFTKDPSVAEAIVEVTAASTQIGELANPNLRQMFITFATGMSGGVLSAVGCGVEVDGSQAVTQKTSIVSLTGSPAGVTSTVLNRVDRAAVQVNELFTMKGTLKANKLTCEVTVKGVKTTATATVSPRTGSIGFFTNQTKAVFKQAKICKLK